jgi:hypothetical protein
MAVRANVKSELSVEAGSKVFRNIAENICLKARMDRRRAYSRAERFPVQSKAALYNV